MKYILILLVACASAFIGMLLKLMARRNMQCWFPAYLRWSAKRRERAISEPINVYLCVADHFEPFWNGVNRDIALRRIQRWCREYEKIASGRRDANGRPPQHTMFYPIEEYDEEILDLLKEFCVKGLGDVEIHLHHDNDTACNLRRQLTEFCTLLYRRHELLRYDARRALVTYGFIHGNWALNNSRRDKRWCGVDGEIGVLKETGCYADFTMPSAPDQTQPNKINCIYFMDELESGRRSLSRGRPLAVGGWVDDGLLAIQGPLCLNWARRHGSIFPAVENGELSFDNPPTPSRVDLWHATQIHVIGRPDHVFIKTHTHGLQEENSDALLGGGLSAMWNHLEGKYNDSMRFRLHYVTARQIYEKIAEISSPIHASSDQKTA